MSSEKTRYEKKDTESLVKGGSTVDSTHHVWRADGFCSVQVKHFVGGASREFVSLDVSINQSDGSDFEVRIFDDFVAIRLGSLHQSLMVSLEQFELLKAALSAPTVRGERAEVAA